MRPDLAAPLRAAFETAAPGDAAGLAARLGMAGLVPTLGLADPRDTARRLHEGLEYTVQREVAREISGALGAAGVRHCVYKGHALAHAYAPGTRSAVDVDLLVAEEDVTAALAVLAGRGLHPATEAWAAAAPALRRGVELVRPGAAPVHVDLAWALAAVHRLISDRRHADLTPVWARIVTREGIAVPADGVHYALVVHHLVHHDLQHARGVVDALLLWAGMDADEAATAAACARRWGVARVAGGFSRAFAARWGPLGPLLPGGTRLSRALDPARLWRLADRSPARAAAEITPARAWRRLGLLDRRRDAWRLARDIVMPPAAYLAWRWPDAGGYGRRWMRHAARTLRKLVGSVL